MRKKEVNYVGVEEKRFRKSKEKYIKNVRGIKSGTKGDNWKKSGGRVTWEAGGWE